MFRLVSGTLTTLVCLSVSQSCSQSCSELTQNKVHTDGQKTVKGLNVATLMTSGWCFFLHGGALVKLNPLDFGGFGEALVPSKVQLVELFVCFVHVCEHKTKMPFFSL